VNKTTQTVESAAAGGAFYIEDVYPLIDGGRFPVKRIVGERVEVWADIYRVNVRISATSTDEPSYFIRNVAVVDAVLFRMRANGHLALFGRDVLDHFLFTYNDGKDYYIGTVAAVKAAADPVAFQVAAGGDHLHLQAVVAAALDLAEIRRAA